MKNRTKFAGIIALAALIGFLGVSCDGGGGDSFHAPNPTLPSLPMGELQDVPAHFWPAGEQAARFGAPITPYHQQQVYGYVSHIVRMLVEGINAPMFLHSDVGLRDGGTLDFAAMPATLTTALTTSAQWGLGLTVSNFSGTVTSNLNAPDFFNVPGSNGAAAIRSSPQVQFQFNPFPEITEGAIAGNRIFGVVRANTDSRMNWNPNREWGTNNYGWTALVGFVIFTDELDGSYTSVGGHPGGVTGVIRISSGSSSRFDGPRISLDFELEYVGVETGRGRQRTASSQATQVGFFNMDRSSLTGGVRNPELAPPAWQGTPSTLPARLSPWERAVESDWNFVNPW